LPAWYTTHSLSQNSEVLQRFGLESGSQTAVNPLTGGDTPSINPTKQDYSLISVPATPNWAIVPGIGLHRN